MTTTTFYPSLDGWVGRGDLGGSREDWATIRSGTGIEHGDTDVTADAILINNYGTETNFKENRRGITLFDTSAIGSGATISSATLSVKPSAVGDHHGGSQALGVVLVNPASTSALADTDYNIAKWTMTRQASDIDLGSLSAGTYADFALNGTGLGNISKTGITKFGWACSGDIDNSSPGNDPLFVTNVTFNFSEQTGTSSDPKLVVTYTSSAAYTLTATQQSYTFTGNAMTPRVARTLAFAYGSFALTMQTVVARYGRKITAAYGSFVLTGNDVMYRLGKGIQAAYGSFTLTGQAIAFKLQTSIVAQTGMFVLTGIAANLNAAIRYTWTLTASTGSFVLTGFQALFRIKGWLLETKKTPNMTMETKKSSTWQLEDKN